MSGWHLTSSQNPRDKRKLLATLTKFTHILSVFIHKIRDSPEGDRDRKDLLDLATHYTHNVLRPSQEELRQDQDLRGKVEVFQQQLDDLETNFRMVRGDSAEAHQEDTISACTALELLIRCLWPTGESFTDADAALDKICEILQGLQLKESIADLTKQYGWLDSSIRVGIPKMIHFAIGSPCPRKGSLLFLGFTKESWPPYSSLHTERKLSREARFSQSQLEKHIGIRNELCDLIEEVERKIDGSANDAKKVERVEIRAQSVRRSWASHPPACRFSTCRAVSFPDFIIRQKCVICKATSNCPRDNDSSLENDLRNPQSLKWHIKRDNFDCAEIMTEAGYEDLSTWSDAQQRQLEENPTHLMLAPPKSSGT